MREKRQAVRSPAALEQLGTPATTCASDSDQLANVNEDTNTPAVDQPDDAAANEYEDIAMLPSHSTFRVPSSPRHETLKDIQKLYLSEARHLDPEAYIRRPRRTAGTTNDSFIPRKYGRSRSTAFRVPFKREHFHDMQDIAEARYERDSLRSLQKDKVASNGTRSGARRVGILQSLVPIIHPDKSPEEITAAEGPQKDGKGHLPVPKDATYRAYRRFDQKHARAGRSSKHGLIDGAEYVDSGWYHVNEPRHGTIMPGRSARSVSASIDSHLRKRTNRQANENLLMSYELVGWAGIIVPRDERGDLIAGDDPASKKAQEVLEKVLSSDKLLREERRLSSADVEGDEYDLIWATKLGCLGNANPYSIKRRGRLNLGSEMEGLRVLPPLHPAPTAEQQAQKLMEAFWAELEAEMATSSGSDGTENYEASLESVTNQFWEDVKRSVKAQISDSDEQAPPQPLMAKSKADTKLRKRGIDQVDSDIVLTSRPPKRPARRKLKAEARKMSGGRT
ncbi:hypothetical protein HII31_07660 [Pseudocercospora fuligena]|uniref:Uncharacterized protein n=1 Tax=Pseudocercospora fuligena TaxID=685502 RepID=A0A8H6RH85_9PEZI|nr:hypothetical protein HII31_07660 [Pseudocercospora fuligena]